MDIHLFWASVRPACSTPCPLGQKSNEPRQHTQLFQEEGTSCLSRGTIDDGEAKPLGPYGDSVPRRRCCGIGFPFQITDRSLHLLQNWTKEKINLLTKRGKNKQKRENSGKWLLPSSCTRGFAETWTFTSSSVVDWIKEKQYSINCYWGSFIYFAVMASGLGLNLLLRDRILLTRLRWSRGSVLAFGTQVRGFKPGRSRRIFRAKKSSARLPSEGK
jgi:hypothetical protein